MAKNKETENPTDDKVMLDGIPGADKKTVDKNKKSVYVVSGTPQSSCGYRKRPTVGLVYLRDRELYVRYKTYLLMAF